MTKKILVALALGIISGLFIIPQKIYAHTGLMMDIGLCLLLFFVGIDLGSNKDIFSNLKKVGFKVLTIPAATIAGSLFGGIICSIIFKMDLFRELLAFIFIPTIARRIGYLETIAAGAAISMDTGLPIITKNTSQELAVISFISGVIISLSVTVLVPIFVGMI